MKPIVSKCLKERGHKLCVRQLSFSCLSDFTDRCRCKIISFQHLGSKFRTVFLNLVLV